ncbi:MAG: hypothetical protein HY318_06190, partial [Armatimonadetes bacterium]|nr:hypothetical protein [Armatimonadota bacterium]
VYYATPQNRFQEIYFNYLRPWIVPGKDPNSPIVRWAFEGIPGGGSVPMMIWKAWVLPVLLWMPLILAIFFVTVCLAALLRKQWVDRERLLFPLAEVPLEVTEAPEGSVGPPLFANWMFWACFLLPTVLYTYRALHQYWPSIPDVNLYRSTENLFSTRPWNTLNWVPMNYYFDMIGITYLLTTEMGFSFWFFYFLRRMTVLVRTAFGMEDHYRFMDLQGQGALIVLGLFYLWVMRHHLWEVVRKGLFYDRSIDDSHEPISYRFAFWGVVGGMAVIVGWCYAIGMPVGWAVALFTVYFGGHLVLTRLVSEAGLFVYWLPAPQMTLINLFGNHLFSNQSLTSLQVVGWKLQDSASSILPNALQGFKVADRSRMSQTSLFVAMIAAIVIAVFACHIPSISVIYRTTVPHLGWWPKGATRALPNQIVNSIINPDPYKSGDFANMGLGATVAGFLLYMRQRFLWWPFHPLGYIGSYSTWFGDRYAWSIFIGWWAKVIVLKAGGATAWRKCRPAALGLIIGNCFVLFLWLLLQLIWPVQQVLVIE